MSSQKPVRGPARTLTPDEFKVLLVLCDRGAYPIRDRAILFLSFKCGLRSTELAGLQIGDVLDGAGGLLEDVVLRPAITKGKKFGMIYLVNPDARAAVTAQIRVRQGEGAGLTGALFVSRLRQPMTANVMQKLIKRMYLRAGLVGSSHSGRRTFATDLEQHDPSLKSIQVLMRLNSIQQAAKYVETSPERLKRLAKKI